MTPWGAALAATLFFCAAAPGAEPAKIKQATGSIIRTKGKIQTGSSSRIEIELPYLAIARIGSNAVFHFSPDYHSLALDSGTMLFAQPKDAGATTVRAGGITTQMAGRAALQLANVAGQVKVIALDGKIVSQLAAKPSEQAKLRAGEMMAVPVGATSMPPVVAIKLAVMLKTSVLFNMGPFPGQRAINQNATKQAPPSIPFFVTGGFDPDWGGGGAATLTTLGPAGTAAVVNQIETNAQNQRAAELAAQQAAQQAATQQTAIVQQEQAQQALLERNRQQAAQALALAAAARAAQQAAAERAAQQQAAQQQGNQGNAFGPGGNPNNPNQGNQGGGGEAGRPARPVRPDRPRPPRPPRPQRPPPVVTPPIATPRPTPRPPIAVP